MMKTMNASRFKATCLEVLDQVAQSGHGVVVTKRGKPVARVVPMVNRGWECRVDAIRALHDPGPPRCLA